MSHFFTKDRQDELIALADNIDFASLGSASAGQILKYDDTEGKFILSSDATGDSLPAATDGDILWHNGGSWSSAGGAGDVGYILGYGESGPVWIPGVLPAAGTEHQIMEWDASGQLVNVDLTLDFLPSSHAASGVTAEKITAWDQAVTWGDHGIAGYSTVSQLSDLSDVDPTGLAAGNHLAWNGAQWVGEAPPDPGTGLPSGTTGGQVLEWSTADGGSWVVASPPGEPTPDNILCAPSQIARWTEADITVDGSDNILESDSSTMVIVMDAWISDVGVATLVLKEGTTGQQIYIKNNSDQPNRAIQIQCGTAGDSSTGSIDGSNGVDFDLPERATVHLLCIDGGTGDGEWIIL